MQGSKLFDAWVDLLRYPAGGGQERVRRRIDQILLAAPELEEDLRAMREQVRTGSESDLEELFTRTFDSNAERALEVGWHLHGENYARGAFMVRMRQLLREHQVPEAGELPDHITHMLAVLARADAEMAGALAGGVLAPALSKIADGFGDQANPYYGVIRSLRSFIEGGHGSRREAS